MIPTAPAPRPSRTTVGCHLTKIKLFFVLSGPHSNTMAEPTIPAEREWPGTGTGAKSDAYANKIVERHEKQYNIVVNHKNMQPVTDAEGGIILAEIHEGQRLVFFQGSFLSNFQPAIFVDGNNVSYTCTEQAFQALKTIFVVREAKAKGLDKIAESAMELYKKIMKSTNALYQKLSASGRFLYMDKEMLDTWANVSGEVMVQLNRLKYGQNPHLRERLLSFNTARILEAIPDDSIWAIGMTGQTAVNGPPADLDPASPEFTKLKDWKGLVNMSREEIDATNFAGKNRQGRIVQHVRDELLAGKESPLEGSDDAVRALVADLFSRTEVAEDEAGPEKEAFRKRVAGFAQLGPIPQIDGVLGKRSSPEQA